jgi:hypothetical protein
MSFAEKQIIEIKIALSNKNKKLISKEIGIDQSYFSKLDTNPGAKEKIVNYFSERYPEFDLAIKKLIEFEFNIAEESQAKYLTKADILKIKLSEEYQRGRADAFKEILTLKNEETYKQTGSE